MTQLLISKRASLIMSKTDCTLLHLEDSAALDAHTFACENKTPYPLEVTLDLSRSIYHFLVSSSSASDDYTLKKVIPPSSYTIVASIKRKPGSDGQRAKLDIDFKCKKVFSK